MALAYAVGYTDDGLVWVKFEGNSGKGGQPVQTTILLERDMADDLGTKLINSAHEANKAMKRIIPAMGQPITIPRH